MNLVEEQRIEDQVELLYNFMEGSRSSRTRFPLAAAKVQTEDFRIGVSKRPAIIHLRSSTLSHRRHNFAPNFH